MIFGPLSSYVVARLIVADVDRVPPFGSAAPCSSEGRPRSRHPLASSVRRLMLAPQHLAEEDACASCQRLASLLFYAGASCCR